MTDHEEYEYEVPDDLSELDRTPTTLIEFEFEDNIPMFLAVSGVGVAEVLALHSITQVHKRHAKMLDSFGSDTRIVMNALLQTVDVKGQDVERTVVVSFDLSDPQGTWSVSYGPAVSCDGCDHGECS